MFFLLVLARCDTFSKETADGRTRQRSQYTAAGSLICRNSVFFKFDTMDGDGGVIAVSATSFSLTVTQCFFWECHAHGGSGGVVYGDKITTLQFVESQIERCGANGDFQAVMIASGDGGNSIDISLSTVYKCRSPETNVTSSHVLGVKLAQQLKLSNVNVSHNRVVGHGAGLSIIDPDTQSVQFVNVDGNIGASMIVLDGNQSEPLALETVNVAHSKVFSERYGIVRFSGVWEFQNSVFYDNGVDVKLCSVDEAGDAEKSLLVLTQCVFDGSWDSAGKEYLLRDSRKEGAPSLASFEVLEATVPAAVMNETRMEENKGDLKLAQNDAPEATPEAKEEEEEDDDDDETDEKDKKLTDDQKIARIEKAKKRMPRLVDTVKQQELAMMAENSSHPSVQVMYPRFCCTCQLRKKLAPGEKVDLNEEEPVRVRKPRKHRRRRRRHYHSRH